MDKKSIRCTGVLASGAPCPRKRVHEEFCGQHHKASQHIVLKLLEVNGVLHFVDDKNAVYDSEAVLARVPDPPILGYCVKAGEKYVMI
jgi:hypothetical protein